MNSKIAVKTGDPLFRGKQPPKAKRWQPSSIQIPSLAKGTWIVFRGPLGVEMTAEVTTPKRYSVRLVDGMRMQLNAGSPVVRVLKLSGVTKALFEAMVKGRRMPRSPYHDVEYRPPEQRGKWLAGAAPWSAKTWVAWKRPALPRPQTRWGGKWRDEIDERGKIATRMKNEYQVIYQIVDISIWRPGKKFHGYVQVDLEPGAHNRMHVIIWENEMKANGWVEGKVAYPVTIKNSPQNEWRVDEVLDVSLLESEEVA